jgi:hypothetical protein
MLTFDELQQAIPRLQKRIAEVEAFDPSKVDPADPGASVHALKASIDDALTRTFGQDTVEYQRYHPAAQFDWPLTMGGRTPPHRIIEALTRARTRSLDLLKQAVAALQERWEDTSIPVLGRVQDDVPFDGSNRRIFIVHGHNTGAREAVARFLERAGFEPIILHEQANQGRTIIEKFEEHAAVNFAVVLLTPDDVGGPAGKAVQPRARQNVVLELGFFIGKLGRGRVCALKSGDLELPTDILGVAWTSLDDAGAWRVNLAKELEAAGYKIDWAKAIG